MYLTPRPAGLDEDFGAAQILGSVDASLREDAAAADLSSALEISISINLCEFL
jgi:hypothetical protein